MASLETRTLQDGRTKRLIVRWHDDGRDGRHRSKSFPSTKQGRKDAQAFRGEIERRQRIGQLADEVTGSDQPLEQFVVEWWRRYALVRLAAATRDSYEVTFDKWVVPYLGHLALRDISRETLDDWVAAMRKDGAGAPTVNRSLAIVQGILRRAVEWRRIQANPAVGVAKLRHQRSGEIRARTPEEVEAIRARVGRQDGALISVLAYVGLRPSEAFALCWRDVLDARGGPRARLWAEGTKTAGSRRSPEVPAVVGRELRELWMAAGKPAPATLVFPAARGGQLARQNWRQRVWKAALDGNPKKHVPAIPYFRPYDLRHTAATLAIYEGRTPGEVAAQLGHADPGFTLRVYTDTFDDARKRRGVTVDQAITTARASVRKARRA